MNGVVTSRIYVASAYSKALADKEASGGIMKRWTHPSLGLVYEVIYLPPYPPAPDFVLPLPCIWCDRIHEGGPENCLD